MQQVSIEDAKRNLPDLIDAAINGEEIMIAKDGDAVVRLVPVPRELPRPQFGSAKGLITMSDDFDEPLELVPERRDAVRQIDDLRQSMFARYGEMPDSVELVNEDRAR